MNSEEVATIPELLSLMKSNVTELKLTSDVLVSWPKLVNGASESLKNFWSIYTSMSRSSNQNFYGGRGEEDPVTGFSNSIEESLLGYGDF